MDFLTIGEKISIIRSDGRVHTALVDSKHEEVQSITVAWTEGSKLMGKEIQWSSVLALNPHLAERNPENEELLKMSDEPDDEEMYNLSDVENMELDLSTDEQ